MILTPSFPNRILAALLLAVAAGVAGADTPAPAPAVLADPAATPAAPMPAEQPPAAEAAPRAQAGSGGPDRSAEIARALDGLNSPVMDERVATCKSLSFSGITDERVYDLIEKNVLAQFAKVPRKPGAYVDHDVEQEIGWCAKALAYPGSEKYRPTLQKLAGSTQRFADHAEASLARIADFARWNAIMNDTAGHRAGESWEMTRAFNMLKSGEPPLEREGLKLIKELKEDPTPLHDLVEAKLLAAYAQPLDSGSDQEDIVAWYCRSLAASRNLKYRETLRRVATGAPSQKVRKYAGKALGDLATAE